MFLQITQKNNEIPKIVLSICYYLLYEYWVLSMNIVWLNMTLLLVYCGLVIHNLKKKKN